MKKILGLLVLLGLGYIGHCQSPCETGTHTINHSQISYVGETKKKEHYSPFFESWDLNKGGSPVGMEFGQFFSYQSSSTTLPHGHKDIYKRAELKFSHPDIRNDQIKSVKITVRLMNHLEHEESWNTKVNSPGNGKYGLFVRNSSCGNDYNCLTNLPTSAYKIGEKKISSQGVYTTHTFTLKDYNIDLMNPSAKEFYIQMTSLGTYRENTSTVYNNGDGFVVQSVSAKITYKKPPTVSFSASRTSFPAGTSINFTDNSTSCPNSWVWSFPGAVKTNSTAQNPTGIKYKTPGKYTVTLKVKNGASFVTKSMSNYITVTKGVQANAGSDKTVCKVGYSSGSNGRVTLSGSASYGTSPYSYKWKRGSTVIGYSSKVTVSNLGSNTVYTLEVKDKNGLKSTDQVTVKTQNPWVDAGSNLKVCENLDFQLNPTSSSGVSYKWEPSIGLSSVSSKSPVGNLPSSQDYNLTVKDNLGCKSSDAVSVVVSNNYPVANAGEEKTICSQAKTVLGGSPTASEGSGSYSYFWSSPSGFSSTESSPEPTVNSTETFTINVKDANGCSSIDEVLVSTTDLPTVDAGNDVFVCFSGTKVIGGDPSGSSEYGVSSYKWVPSEGLNNQNIANPEASPENTTTYILMVTDINGCTSSDDVLFTVSKPKVNSLGDKDICFDASTGVQLASASTEGFGDYSYDWQPAEGISDPTKFDAIAKPSESTLYLLTVTDEAGCTASENIEVTVNSSKPNVYLGDDLIHCEGLPIELKATVSGGTGSYDVEWTPEANLSSNSILNPLSDASVRMTYTLTIRDVNGCVSEGEIDVDVHNKIDVDVANLKLCELNSSKPDVSIFSGDQPFIWNWSDNEINVSNNTSSPTISLKSAITEDSKENVLITDQNGCTQKVDYLVMNTGYIRGVFQIQEICGEYKGVNDDVIAYERIEMSNSCSEGVTINEYAELNLKAGNKVILSDGFSAKRDSKFKAYIESQCNPWSVNTEEVSSVSFEYEIYPNPSNGILTVRIYDNDNDIDMKNSKIDIYNLAGELVLQESIKPGEYNYQLDLSNIVSGLYFTVIKIDGKSHTERVSVVR
jgi:hypothetical protein